MKKISRQLTRVSTPPSSGPEDEATAPPIAHTATARARRAGSGCAWLISAIDEGIITAAPALWANRAATSALMAGASPHAAEARTNTASPAPNARRAPNRSDTDPADSSRAANISVYPSTTHCSPVIPPPRPARIDGNATLTTTASRVIMKKPSTAAASVKPGLAAPRMPGTARDGLVAKRVDTTSSFLMFPHGPGAGGRCLIAATHSGNHPSAAPGRACCEGYCQGLPAG